MNIIHLVYHLWRSLQWPLPMVRGAAATELNGTFYQQWKRSRENLLYYCTIVTSNAYNCSTVTLQYCTVL